MRKSDKQEPKNDETKETNSEIVDDAQVILKQQLLIDALKEQNQDLVTENEKLKNDYYRVHADMENFRKRKNNEVSDIMKYRAQGFITEILPVLDNFERALQTEGFDPTIKVGIEMIYQQLLNALQQEGVQVRDNLHQDFDPNFDQALATEAVEGMKPNQVIEVLQKGYILKDRLLRASLVKVSQ